MTVMISKFTLASIKETLEDDISEVTKQLAMVIEEAVSQSVQIQPNDDEEDNAYSAMMTSDYPIGQLFCSHSHLQPEESETPQVDIDINSEKISNVLAKRMFYAYE